MVKKSTAKKVKKTKTVKTVSKNYIPAVDRPTAKKQEATKKLHAKATEEIKKAKGQKVR